MTAEADFAAWERQIAATGGCSRPVRIRGKIVAVDLATGELAPVYDTATEPGMVLHIACGNRRETACPSCSAVYKRDTRQLIRAGLIGGKGVPDSIAEHPCVFATFTAPGFGPVHARRERNGIVLPCRPRRDRSKRVCPHGRDTSCPVRHHPEDARLGRPMCPDCYDYESAVVFNAGASKLWRRFLTYLPRELAKARGITQKRFRTLVRARFVKVAEYQKRGVIHYHAIIRLDLAVKDPAVYLPPPDGWTAELLAAAVTAAASAAWVVVDAGNTGRSLRLRFGAQVDPRVIKRGTASALTQGAVANYIAKYVTKTSEVAGMPDYPLRTELDLIALRCPPHTRRMIETAWNLGYAKWAHQLGAGGHPVTKSRRFSVTYGHLRGERRHHRRTQRHPGGELDPWGRPVDETLVLYLAEWHYAGTGYHASDAHSLALMAADNARKPA